jgi:hypothetical protein
MSFRFSKLRWACDRYSIGDVASVSIGMAVGTILLVAALWLALKIMLPIPASAHEWYPPLCCSGGDCGPVDPSRIEREGVDYIIDHRWHVKRSSTTPSPDGQFHGCWPDKDKPPVCVFAPPDGM